MADLGAVEIPLVVREQGLRESLRTVNRLEAEIRRAVAAANAQQISQERLNKTLLAAKREYQQLGVSSQKATAEVRKFAAAAQMQQTAMMGSTRGMNSMGVGMQQLGYQVGDFLVQVQSGTNALVAFGQQATQVVGFLPMMTKSFMGLSGTALVAFSAGLGIVIPLVTALGAAFMRTREAADTASAGFVGIRTAMENARAETAEMADEIERLNRGLRSNAELNLVRAIEEQTKIVDQRREALEQLQQTELDGVVVAEQRLQNEQETLDELVYQLDTLRLTSEELETVKEETEEAERAARGMADELERAANAVMNINTAAFDKLQELQAELRGRTRGLTDAQIRIQQAAIRAEREAREAGVDSAAELAAIAAEAAEIERQIIDAEGALEGFNETGTSGTSKVTEEVEKLANELDGPLKSSINSVANAWADFVMRGFQDFGSFVDNILNSFKNLLAQMISMAARNQIMFNMGMSGGGAVMGGGGGILGSLVNTVGGGGGSILGNLAAGAGQLLGLGGTFTGAFGAGLGATITGGLAGGMGAFTTGLSMLGGGSGLAGAISGLQMAAGAALPVIGAVVAAINFFRGSTKELDSGLRVTIDNMATLVETFSVIEKKRFFGLSKSVRTNLGEADPAVADPVNKAVREIQNSVVDMARSLNIGADAFDKFSYVLDISLKGLSEEEATAKLQEELLKIGDAMAGLIPDLEQFSRGGETLGQTLSRLSTSLTTVNNTFRSLGFTLFDVSLAGADAASSLVDLFGGLEQFQQTTSFYFQNFYSSTEQLQAGAQNLAIVLSDLGVGVLPKTRQEFRALIDTLMSAGETAKAAEVMQLAPAFVNLMNIADQVRSEAQAAAQQQANAIQQAAQESVRAAQDQYNNAVRTLREAISREENRIEDAARSLVDALEDQLNAAEDRLSQQTDIVDALRDALLGRRIGTAEDQTNQLREANQYLRSLVGQGRIEDEDALKRALGVVEKPSVDLFENFVDYQRSFGRTSNVIDDLLSEQEKTLTADQQAVEALEIQIARAEEWKNQQLNALSDQAAIAESTFNNVSSVREATNNVQAAIVNLNKETIAAQEAQVEATNIMKNALINAFESAFDINLSGGNDPSVTGSGATVNQSAAIELMQNLGKYTEGSYADNPIDFYSMRGVEQVRAVAKQLNILTAGKLGSEIQQEISNALGAAIQLDNTTRRMQFALGGLHSGGVRLVGEQGPELEFTGPANIKSARETRSLLSGDEETKEEIRELRRDMKEMHKESMMAYAKIVRFEKDQRDTLRTWDITGLPETRTS